MRMGADGPPTDHYIDDTLPEERRVSRPPQGETSLTLSDDLDGIEADAATSLPKIRRRRRKGGGGGGGGGGGYNGGGGVGRNSKTREPGRYSRRRAESTESSTATVSVTTASATTVNANPSAPSVRRRASEYHAKDHLGNATFGNYAQARRPRPRLGLGVGVGVAGFGRSAPSGGVLALSSRALPSLRPSLSLPPIPLPSLSDSQMRALQGR